MGYILKKINHLVWFGIGLFHMNNIESLRGQNKRYTHNLIGLYIENLRLNLIIMSF